MNREIFKELIWEQGRRLYRDMPWRDRPEPYFVLVSELMLQQTQAARVIPKFNEFIAAFPTIRDLADASLADVLKQWNGLGYNRRAQFLHLAAQKVMTEFDGEIPDTLEQLMTLPGVGPNTAGAILAYGFNKPALFIETNIRTVYFHHFFEDRTDITDKELKEIVNEMTDIEHPREWYWALMDYGSYLKRQGYGANDKSRHYKKQSPLKGSLREVRGAILKFLTVRDYEAAELKEMIPNSGPDDSRFETALAALQREGVVMRTGQRLHLPEVRYNKEA